jgi:hypothetical protein
MPRFKALKPTSYMPPDSVVPVQVGAGEVIEAPQSPGYSFEPVDKPPAPPSATGRLANGLQFRRDGAVPTDFFPDPD